jgi:predicted signal transduction protein with EAL and GGDEF domain
MTAVANRIIHAIGEPFDLEGSQVNVGVSIGIVAAPAHGDDPTDLVKKADIALYRSKSGGRNRHCFFDAEMLDDLEARNQLEQDLRAAIVDGKLELHYQPYVDAKTGAICGVEALARWSHPERGMIPPDQFIPLAERSGLIVPLGN